LQGAYPRAKGTAGSPMTPSSTHAHVLHARTCTQPPASETIPRKQEWHMPTRKHTRASTPTHVRARTHAPFRVAAWLQRSCGVQLAVTSKLNVTFPADQPGSSDPKARGCHARTHTHAHTRARAYIACMPARTGCTGPQRGWALLRRAARSQRACLRCLPLDVSQRVTYNVCRVRWASD
jgi:hypothetical protein